MIGIIIAIGMCFWALVTLVVFALSDTTYSFLQSGGFVVVAIGWVVLFAAWPICKKIIGEEEEW